MSTPTLVFLLLHIDFSLKDLSEGLPGEICDNRFEKCQYSFRLSDGLFRNSTAHILLLKIKTSILIVCHAFVNYVFASIILLFLCNIASMAALQQFLSFIKQHALFDADERVLLAVSGGRDSVLMTYFFKLFFSNHIILK